MVKLFTVLMILAAPAGAFGIQGIEVGQPLGAVPANVTCSSFGLCNGSIDVLTFGGDITFYMTQAGTVDDLTLTIPAHRYGELAAALTAKYGKPSNSGSLPLQNGFGAQVTTRMLEWKAADGSTATLMEYTTLRDSTLLIRSKQPERKSAGI